MIKVKGKIGETFWYENVFAVIWTIYALCRWGFDGTEEKLSEMKQEILRKKYNP